MADLQTQPASAAGSQPADSSAVDALSHLARMSGTGSSFGQADYVAINPLSIISLLLGFAAGLSLVLSLFLFIPALGIICGLVSIRQIRRSNGTQSGVGFAAGGIVLSLLLGGAVVGLQVAEHHALQAQSQEVATVLSDFGQQISAGHYEHAYQDLTTHVFRDHVTLANFTNMWRELQANAAVGRLQSMAWNGERMEFQPSGDGKSVYTMAVVKFEKMQEEGREVMRLSNIEGGWRVDGIPRLFPEEKAKRGAR